MAAPEILRKEYGPFTGAVWLVIIVGGVGLGLVMRRFMVGRGGDSVTDVATPNPTDTAFVGGGQIGGGGGGTLYNQGEIVADVLEAIEAQKPPPATTQPTVTTAPIPPPLYDPNVFVDYGEPGWWTAAQRFEDVFGYQPSKTATVAKINAEIARAQAKDAK